jgi:hypothetical protein
LSISTSFNPVAFSSGSWIFLKTFSDGAPTSLGCLQRDYRQIGVKGRSEKGTKKQ